MVNNDIEKIVENEDTLLENNNSSWVAKAYREEWPTMGNHVIACATSIAAATGFSAIGPEYIDSDAAISGIATVLDFAGYWGVFIPQLMFRDRGKMYNEDGSFSFNKMKKKFGEYLGYIGLFEGAYVAIRFTSQYFMQKNGIDPVVAAATIQTSAAAIFTGVWPLIRYGARQFSEEKV